MSDESMELSEILKIEDKTQQSAALLVYGAARIERAGKIYGVDSTEYTDAVTRWSEIIRSHLAYA